MFKSTHGVVDFLLWKKASLQQSLRPNIYIPFLGVDKGVDWTFPQIWLL